MSRKMNIDQFFKSALYKRDIPFDEAAWKDVEKMLDQHDRKVAGRWRWIGLFSIGAIALLSFFALEQTQHTSGAGEEQVEFVAAPNSGKTIEPSATHQTDGELLTASTTANNIVPKNQQAAVVEVSDQTRDALETKRQSKAIKREEYTAAEESEQGTSVSAQVDGPSLSTKSPAVGQRNSEKWNKPNRDLIEEVGEESDQSAILTMKLDEVEGNESGGLSVVGHDEPGQKSETATPLQVREQSVTIAMGEANTPTIKQMVDLKLNKEQMRVPITSIQLPVKLNAKPVNSLNEGPVGGLNRRSIFDRWGIITGAGIGSGVRNSESETGTSSRVMFAGLRYAHPVTGRFSVQGNFVYRRIGNLQARSEFETTEYDFGYNTTRTIIESKTLHYVGIPIYLNYYTGLFNIYAGMEYDWLLNVKSDVVVEQEGTFSDQQTTQSKPATKYGYRGHFEDHQLSAIGGVEYLINERLCVGLRLNYGLNALNLPAYFSGVETRMTDLKITVNYSLKRIRR